MRKKADKPEIQTSEPLKERKHIIIKGRREYEAKPTRKRG